MPRSASRENLWARASIDFPPMMCVFLCVPSFIHTLPLFYPFAVVVDVVPER